MKKYEIYIKGEKIATFKNKKDLEGFTKNLKCEYDQHETIIQKQFFDGVILLNKTHTIEELDKIIKTIEKELNTESGEIIKFEYLGLKQLAYKVKEQTHAYYIEFRFYIEDTDEERQQKIAELERFFRLNDTILKFITMRINEEEI